MIPNGSLIFMQVLNYSQLAPWEVSWSIKEHFQCFYAWLSEPDNSVFYFDFHNEKINTSYLLSRIPWWHKWSLSWACQSKKQKTDRFDPWVGKTT